MRSHLARFGATLTFTLWIACGQDPVTDSDSAVAIAGSGAAGATAGSSSLPIAGGGAGVPPAIGTAGASGAAAGRSGASGSAGIGRAGGPSATGGAGAPGMPAGQAGAASGSGGSGAGGMPASAGASGTAVAGGGAGAPSAAFEPCPASGACKILPLGDSITFGIGYSGGYRVELFRRARADGKNITFTGSVSNGPNMVDGVPFPRNNEGHSGWKIDQLLPLIPMPALADPPHIVLLMIGTNDIAQNDDLADAPERLGGLIDELVMNAPDALIVVAKLTPLGRSATAVQTYNAAIPALVEERAAAGRHVMIVDQFTGFPTSELGDGVHPNQRGYERMAGVWYEAIGKLLR